MFRSVSCYLSNGPLKEDFLDLYLTRFFGVRSFQKRSAVRVIFFKKMFKIESEFRKCEKKKTKKIFFLSEIVASENVAINYLY